VKGKRKFGIHAIGWGLPFIFTTTLAARYDMGFNPPIPWCFLITGYDGQFADSPDYPFFYIPLIFVLMVAAAMFLAVLIKVVRVRYATVRSAGSSSISLRSHLRLLIFGAALMILFVLVVEWRIVLQLDNPAEIAQVDMEWTICKVKEQLGVPNPGNCSGSAEPLSVDFGHTAFETALGSSTGIILFLIFGSDPSIFVMWAFILQCMWRKQWEELLTFLKDGHVKTKTQRKTSSSSLPSLSSCPSSGSISVTLPSFSEMNDETPLEPSV